MFQESIISILTRQIQQPETLYFYSSRYPHHMVLNELGDKIAGTLSKFYKQRRIDKDVIKKVVGEIINALQEADVSQAILKDLQQTLTNKLIASAPELQQNNEVGPAGVQQLHQTAMQLVCQELAKLLDPGTRPVNLQPGKCNIVAFYGLQGQGKTTTVAKYGAYHKRRGWRVGIVCCDTFRAGAFDQLKQNCTAAKLPYYGDYNEKDPKVLAKAGVEHFKKHGFNLILLDTSGRHQQSEELLQEMREIDSVSQPTERIFVVDASVGQAVGSQAKAFKSAVDIGSIILTKMDGSVKSGGALAAVSAAKAPIVFIGTGEKLHSIEPFDAQRFVSRLLGMGDLTGVFEKVMDSGIDQKKSLESLTNMMDGGFTFQGFRDQIEQVMKLGDISQLIEMIPGMKAIANEYGFDDEKEGTAAFKRWIPMFRSMTPKELSSKPEELSKLNLDQRIKRIARGSGYTMEQVRGLFKYAKLYAEQLKRLGSNQYGQNLKQMMALQQEAMAKGIDSTEGMQQLMAQKNMSGQQQNFMNSIMQGQIPGFGGIPGMGGGAMDPAQAVQQLKSMGLLPDTNNPRKMLQKARKIAKGHR